MTSGFTVQIPAAAWMTSNGRYHWAARARRARVLRARAAAKCRRHHIHAGGPVRVVAEIGYRAGRVDPANSYPTIKALTDGMTHHLDLIRHVWIGRHMQLAAVCACGWESSPQRDRRRAQATYERHTRKATTS